MKIFYAYLLTVFFFLFFNCEKKTNIKENKVEKLSKNKDSSELNISDSEIALDPIISEVPEFSNAEVNKFINKTKAYYEEVYQAAKDKNLDKEIELQHKSIEIDTEFLQIKNKLSNAEQKQLENWYMKLVESAAY
ncbi:hypothetical protein ETU09_09185 [Apibacter muscae]|uniref:Uncharacterized protein n=1 Tax=Apibacter muscae TaxID=2509004 RepID=A0A563DAB3_9FLAO|nr:hypothetical protein [Apibacter muscae]TWP26724.1 hypothetical protein ETU09_09185 [Apibacter muscae]